MASLSGKNKANMSAADVAKPTKDEINKEAARKQRKRERSG
jgi:hypothetical protein